MTVTDESIEAIFESRPIVDRVLTAEDRYQRKPSGSSDQGNRED